METYYGRLYTEKGKEVRVRVLDESSLLDWYDWIDVTIHEDGKVTATLIKESYLDALRSKRKEKTE